MRSALLQAAAKAMNGKLVWIAPNSAVPSSACIWARGGDGALMAGLAVDRAVEGEWIEGSTSWRKFPDGRIVGITETREEANGAVQVVFLDRTVLGGGGSIGLKYRIYFGFADELAAELGALTPLADRCLGSATEQKVS